MVIHFLGNFFNCYARHYYPVRLFSNELMNSGFKVRFFPSPAIPSIKECDVLVVFADGLQDIVPKNIDLLDYLKVFFNCFDKVVWFDDNDSSGMLNASIFPYVNVYAKPQLLKDTSYYLSRHSIGALHRDYVCENFNIADRSRPDTRITEGDINKLRLVWNLGLINWNYYYSPDKLRKIYYTFTCRKHNLISENPSFKYRTNQVSFRGRMWESEPTVGWWRAQTVKLIGDMGDKDLIIDAKKIPRQQYLKELTHGRITISPYGKGEICYRDFESFISGSLLYKPNMNHIITWPNLYVDGETYVSHKWDFSDFKKNIDDVYLFPDKYEKIALEGRKRFERALVDTQGFLNIFSEMVF